jgi:hypothetical protein
MKQAARLKDFNAGRLPPNNRIKYQLGAPSPVRPINHRATPPSYTGRPDSFCSPTTSGFLRKPVARCPDRLSAAKLSVAAQKMRYE